MLIPESPTPPEADVRLTSGSEEEPRVDLGEPGRIGGLANRASRLEQLARGGFRDPLALVAAGFTCQCRAISSTRS